MSEKNIVYINLIKQLLEKHGKLSIPFIMRKLKVNHFLALELIKIIS